MDKTGIYKNRLVAILRTNRMLIILVAISILILAILPVFIPQDWPGLSRQNEVKLISAVKLNSLYESQMPIAPLIRCVVQKHNLKIYLPDNPSTRASFFQTWSAIPKSILPVHNCKDYPRRCEKIYLESVDQVKWFKKVDNIDEVLSKEVMITMGKKDYAVPYIDSTEGLANTAFRSPYYIAALTDCVPPQYQLHPRPIGRALIAPGDEKNYLDIGTYYTIQIAYFLSSWGFIFVIVLIFLGYNKRPYSTRVEDHRHWSIK